MTKKSEIVYRVRNKIIEKSLLKNGDNVVVSLSGGRDSVALLNFLISIKKDLDLKLEAFHVNYGLRGKESERDEKFVARLAKKLDIPLINVKANKSLTLKRGENTQVWARRIRREWYEKLLGLKPNLKIAIAHTLDDQVETFLMRIIRGSGTKGLGGMRPISKGYLIRPLLSFTRGEINQYIEENKLEFVEDSSNKEKYYFRNWIRGEIIPIFDKQNIYQNVKVRIGHLMRVLRLESDCLNKISKECFKNLVKDENDGFLEIDIMKFLEIHPSLRYRILRLCLHKMVGTLRGFSLSHIEDIEKLIKNSHGSKEIKLPKGVFAKRRYNLLIFSKGDAARAQVRDFEYGINPPCRLEIKEIGRNLAVGFRKGGVPQELNPLRINLNNVKGGLTVRNFRAGDRILINEREGYRKVKNILINKKIPKDERKKIPFIIDGDRIAGIFGIAIGSRYKISGREEKILEVILE